MRRFTFQVNGQTYRRVSKHAARQLFERRQPFQICPVNFRPGLPFAMDMTIDPLQWISEESEKHRWGWYDYPREQIVAQAFDKAVCMFEWYNCTDSETGAYSAFYVID